MEKRKENFYDDYVRSLMAEAARLGITKSELIELIEKSNDGGDVNE